MRRSGILMHISSLPNDYGIGKLGKEAYAFVDFLEKAHQKCWQILPISPTSYGDSPYQSFSVHAGNPYFIDLEALEKDGYLKAAEYKNIEWGDDKGSVDYGKIYEVIFKVLRTAHKRFRKKPEKAYSKFVVENKDWIYDYALFMSLKLAIKGKAWLDVYALFMALIFAIYGKAWYVWDDPLIMYMPKAIKCARYEFANDIDFWCFVQYKYFQQWKKLKAYANEKGIEIIGDIPIYVAYDSVEVWSTPQYFSLDKEKMPVEESGCPPDAFTADGQLWGNPLYNWEYIARDKFRWWVERIKAASNTYDVVRIDHFRGFESYYCIPYGAKNAKKGKWRKGPDMRLFKEVRKQLGDVKIIAEDLGFLTKHVVKMLNASGYPGMKVLEFGFDSDNTNGYLPHNFKTTNSICYTGTHDNETILGWIKSCDEKTRSYCKDYLGVTKDEFVPWAMVRLCWSSVCDTAIAQMQDILCLDDKARMNTPSTVGANWKWRLESFDKLDDTLAERLAKKTAVYGR